jgi:21S rRNA (uridine2791-2'-O)-methyltransferase
VPGERAFPPHPQVVLSDMSAPWPQTHGFSINSLSNPHTRMMNTSGIAFKDHAGSMVYLAISFLSFSFFSFPFF